MKGDRNKPAFDNMQIGTAVKVDIIANGCGDVV